MTRPCCPSCSYGHLAYDVCQGKIENKKSLAESSFGGEEMMPSLSQNFPSGNFY
jgi:hypothetical protein